MLVVLALVIAACGTDTGTQDTGQTGSADEGTMDEEEIVMEDGQMDEDDARLEGSYTLADVAGHDAPDSCWTAINGNVYDLTDWIQEHPGGEANIIRLCGIDGTEPFLKKHGGQAKPEENLDLYKIGALS